MRNYSGCKIGQFLKKLYFFGVISSDLRKIYDQTSDDWCADAKAFSLVLLAAMEQLEDRV
ncbi:MAG: hypothetical protein ACJAZ9_001397, partial [Neolewinella sp.]